MDLVLVCLLLFCIWCAVLYKRKKDVFDDLKKLPGPPRLPFVGTLYLFIRISREDILTTYSSFIKKYRPIGCLWNRSVPELILTKPEHVEVILKSTANITKGSHYHYMRAITGDGLVTSAGPLWHRDRKRFQPSFGYQMLKDSLSVFVRNTENLLKLLDTEAGAKSFNIYRYCCLFTLTNVHESGMGVSATDTLEHNSEILKDLEKLEIIMVWRMFHPYVPDFIFGLLPRGRKLRHGKTVIDKFVEKMIADRKVLLTNKLSDSDEKTKTEENKRQCLMDVMLADYNGQASYTIEDIITHVLHFTDAGYSTTASAISSSILFLGNNPEIQDKVFAEISEVLQDKLIPTTMNELREMQYLECVVKETMRLLPAIPIMSRRLEEECYIDGLKIPAGADVVISLYDLHRNEDHFPNPEKFDPDRFLPENSVGRHPYAFIPFSLGLRNCIGSKFAMFQMKTVLASIVKRYKIKSLQQAESVKYISEISLKPLNGIFVELERRDSGKPLY